MSQKSQNSVVNSANVFIEDTVSLTTLDLARVIGTDMVARNFEIRYKFCWFNLVIIVWDLVSLYPTSTRKTTLHLCT